MVALFTSSIFLSAFLLFLVQPMFAKMLLPMLGGAPAVWNTAMVFYQVALVAGYGYAHLSVAKLGLRRQVPFHLVLIVLPAFFVPLAVATGNLPLGGQNPVPWLLATMLVSVGLPFFVISTTSPLLQRWFSTTEHPHAHDPYFLYSAGNVGSILALIAYPLWIEPNLSVAAQSMVWGGGYLLLAVLLAACGLAIPRAPHAESAESARPNAESADLPTWRRRARWILLAFVPSSLMMGLTTFVSTDVAVIPLFWIVPLALYLLTFIIVFSRKPVLPHRWIVLAFPFVLAALVFVLAAGVKKPGWLPLAFHIATFFMACLLCHGEMARDRPAARHLTEFFFWMSLGGALGGAFNALLAPNLFRTVFEYTSVILLAGFLLPSRDLVATRRKLAFDLAGPALICLGVIGAIFLERNFGLTSSKHSNLLILGCGALGAVLCAPRPMRFGLSLVGLSIAGAWQDRDVRTTLYAARSFFGVHRVVEPPGGKMRHLLHGQIVHGTQIREPGLANTPTAYYYSSGPVGQLFLSRRPQQDAKVAVVGLGIGALAFWSTPGQEWTFFEIDPEVYRIASNPAYFTCLADAKGKVEVVLGDARVSLAATGEKFDLLILDAFSSDAVPAHLLTVECMRLYLERLKPGGLIVMNVTNKHLDLEPLLAANSDALGTVCVIQHDNSMTKEDRIHGKASSSWAILARRESDLGPLRGDSRWRQARTQGSVSAWTDDYSSVLSVFRNW